MMILGSKTFKLRYVGRPHNHQRGMTLIELMIAMAIGLFISAGALSMYAATMRANRDSVELAQVTQELHSIMQTMVRELRRSGFHSDITPAFTTLTISDTTNVGDQDCILYRWDDTAAGGALNILDPTDQRGFRRNGSVIEWRKSNDANAPDCNAGVSTGWSAMNDSTLLQINALTFTKPTVNPCQINIVIDAVSPKDPDLAFSLTDIVAVRNIAACP